MASTRILIVGAGHVGLYVALRLSRRLRRRMRHGEVQITVVDPQPHLTYQPFLPEAAAGSISPRHAVVPLRRELRRCEIVTGAVVRIDHTTRMATVAPIIGPPRDIPYDHIVVAPGSVSRTLPIPGLREQAVGFKTIGEASYLRDHALGRLDVAAATADPATRRQALTFVFVGGGYAGVEALAEMEDMVRGALRYYPEIDRRDMRWVLVEATDRILPEVGHDLGVYALGELRRRGMDIRLGTRLESCVDGLVRLSDGAEFPADTIVWTAGVKPHPMLAQTDLPRTSRGAVLCLPTLQVVDMDGQVVAGAWSAGDCAAVPDLVAGPGHPWPVDPTAPPDAGSNAVRLCAPSAQHAVRQARCLADNLVAALRGRPLTEYRHSNAGSVASLGLYQGVAQIYGIRLKGFPAWFMHRTYHMSRIPSLNRKIRVVADWTLGLVLRREVVSLGGLHQPRQVFLASVPGLRDDQGKDCSAGDASGGHPMNGAEPQRLR